MEYIDTAAAATAAATVKRCGFTSNLRVYAPNRGRDNEKMILIFTRNAITLAYLIILYKYIYIRLL